jgi:hypothetical protein
MATIEYEAQVGVGDGSGQLFVYGSYDAVKRVQALILENERLRRLQPFNGLSPAEVERLALLAEEMGEAIQVVGKVLRHGYESHNPNDPERTTNRKLLMHELGDVRHSVDRMCDADDVSKQIIGVRARLKGQRVKQYLHHQPTNQGESE